MQLSRDERRLLLAVASHDEDRNWRRLEDTLGISWDLMDLFAPKEPKPASGQVSRRQKIPMLAALAPEVVDHIIKEQRKKYARVAEIASNAGGGKVIDVGTLSAEEAKEHLRRIGAMAAAIPSTPEQK